MTEGVELQLRHGHLGIQQDLTSHLVGGSQPAQLEHLSGDTTASDVKDGGSMTEGASAADLGAGGAAPDLREGGSMPSGTSAVVMDRDSQATGALPGLDSSEASTNSMGHHSYMNAAV